jgi:hypothetical protein
MVTASDIRSRFDADFDLSADSQSDDNKDLSQGGRKYAEESDKWDTRINSWFEILNSRGQLYGVGYPFDIERSSIRVKKSLGKKPKSYIFLLACSVLEKLRDPSKFTSIYEGVCAIAMKEYLPVIAQVHVFGKSGFCSSRYNGSKFSKIDKLSKDLGMKHIYEENDYNSLDSGDGGLDIIAWLPFRDDINQTKMNVYIGQCASGKDWISKQEEPRKIVEPIPQLKNAVGVIFIPYDIRDVRGDFYHKTEVSVSLVLDRFRIYKLLNYKDDQWFSRVKDLNAMIDQLLSWKEPLF